MSNLTDAIGKVTGPHAAALRWFDQHRDKRVTWAEISSHAETGVRLATLAKGIYKPSYTDYALSVSQRLGSPYADKAIERRSDGSWVYPYYQENSDPQQRDKEATNRGLMKCMEDGVPVGVLMQVKPKPGVEYHVLGLAIVSEWKDGYFILEGFSADGALNVAGEQGDAAHDRAKASALALPVDDFKHDPTVDMRERRVAEIIRRRGQPKFRATLITAYAGRCAITGCDALEALEAAHITPYRGEATNHPQNGLLLRADLHSLFDLGLIAVNPETMSLVVAIQLSNTSYSTLAGTTLAEPTHPSFSPSLEALAEHLKWTGIDTSTLTLTSSAKD